MPYQIYVLAAQGGNRLAQCLEELKQQLYANTAPLIVVGAKKDIANLPDSAKDWPSIDFIEFDPKLSLEQAYVSAFSHWQEAGDDSRDVIFIADCLLPTHWFDLRLSLTAARHPHVATVSPLCPIDPLTSPLPYGLVYADFSNTEALDAVFSYTAGVQELLEVPSFLPECVYLRSTFLNNCARAPLTPQNLLLSARDNCASQGVAPHIFLGSPKSEWRSACWAEATLKNLGHANAISHFLHHSPYENTLRAFYSLRDTIPAPSVANRLRRRNLHVMHSWGGGLERWVRLYCEADTHCENYVLKSITDPTGSTGTALALFRRIEDTQAIGFWSIPSLIRGTAATHVDYQRIFSSIVEAYAIDTIIISSLIGHSLDIFQTSLNTVVVAHDYYLFCPAIYTHFHSVCQKCDVEKLAECFASNPLNHFFKHNTAQEWQLLRERFIKHMLEGETIRPSGSIKLVAPSPSVIENYQRFLPEFKRIPTFVIPHGDLPETDRHEEIIDIEIPPRTGKLRLVVLGRMSWSKGEHILTYLLKTCSADMEFYILGCGEEWAKLNKTSHYVMPDYNSSQLPAILKKITPDASLLLSVWPETFSFTLQECLCNQIPPIASRLGAFQDRITDGINGFLVAPEAEAFREKLTQLIEQPDLLRQVQTNLNTFQGKTAKTMVSEYEAVIDQAFWSERAYFLKQDCWSSSLPASIVRHQEKFKDFLQRTEKDFIQYYEHSESLGHISHGGVFFIRFLFAAIRGLNKIRKTLLRRRMH